MRIEPPITPEQRSMIVQARREIERIYSGSLTLGINLERGIERVLAELVRQVRREEEERHEH